MFTEGLDESAINWIKQVTYYINNTLPFYRFRFS